jgi:putative ABC transport system permease protein
VAGRTIARWASSGNVIARLQDGASIAVATDEANAIGEGVRPKPTSGPLSRPLPPGERRFVVEGVKEQIVAASRPALRVIAIAVGAVLLIVCANVASLLLVRGTSRQREIAVRLAVGASRGRILRQFITESLLLALIGGVLGTALAVGFVGVLREFASPHAEGVFQFFFGGSMVPRLHEVGVDGRLFGLALALAVITALLVGAMPAFRMSRIDHAQVMDDRGAGGRGGASRVSRASTCGYRKVDLAEIVRVQSELGDRSHRPDASKLPTRVQTSVARSYERAAFRHRRTGQYC